MASQDDPRYGERGNSGTEWSNVPKFRPQRLSGTTAFSLLVYTEQPTRSRLFLKTSPTSLPFPGQTRSENALGYFSNSSYGVSLRSLLPLDDVEFHFVTFL